MASNLEEPFPLENHFLPGDLEAQIEAFVNHYNHQRYHEILNNVTPSNVYFGRGQAILNRMERIKRKTFETWRLQGNPPANQWCSRVEFSRHNI